MTELMVNGQAHPLVAGTTLIDLVARTTGRSLAADGSPVDGSRLGVAVALDQRVVPRSCWQTTELSGGETVEIITAMQGG